MPVFYTKVLQLSSLQLLCLKIKQHLNKLQLPLVNSSLSSSNDEFHYHVKPTLSDCFKQMWFILNMIAHNMGCIVK